MNDILRQNKPVLIALIVALVVAFSSLMVVPETMQAVIVRTGDPVRVVNRFRPNADFGQTGAGLVARIPFFEQVVWIDKRVLDVDRERQQVLSVDQRRLEVDAYARFRIIDPVKMVKTAGTTERVSEQLQPILNSVLRQELGKRSFASLLTADRGEAMKNIRNGLDREAREYGAQVIDVRIKRADLPDGTPLESAFQRMQSARNQEATTIRAQGDKSPRSPVRRRRRRLPRLTPTALAKTPSSTISIARCRATMRRSHPRTGRLRSSFRPITST